MNIKNIFKSKEEKAMEVKLELKRDIQTFKKSDKDLERKKNEMIKHAQEAKREGLNEQYQTALNSLKTILGYQKRLKAMILQIEIMESKYDVANVSTDFMKTMGNVGVEMSQLVKSMNFSQNELDFEKGMLQADTVMQQMDDFLDEAGLSLEEMSDDEMTKEVEQLIDVTGSTETDSVDEEIDRRLKELEQKKAALKE